MFYQLTYRRDWLDNTLPIRDIELLVYISNNRQMLERYCRQMNEVADPTEHWQVYEVATNTKRLTKKARLIYQ